MPASQLAVRVTPRSAADQVGPYAGGVLAVRVTRPPADGEANASVIRLVARALGVASNTVRLAAGDRSRNKRLAVSGLSPEELAARLRGIGPSD